MSNSRIFFTLKLYVVWCDVYVSVWKIRFTCWQTETFSFPNGFDRNTDMRWYTTMYFPMTLKCNTLSKCMQQNPFYVFLSKFSYTMDKKKRKLSTKTADKIEIKGIRIILLEKQHEWQNWNKSIAKTKAPTE